MVQLQLILKQMGHGLLHDSNNQAANTNLDKLILMLFHHSMTSEEAFYVGEMVRGVDTAVAGKVIAFLIYLPLNFNHIAVHKQRIEMYLRNDARFILHNSIRRLSTGWRAPARTNICGRTPSRNVKYLAHS